MHSGRGGKLGTQARLDLANAYAEHVKQNADELADLIAAETGKLVWETKTEAAAVVGKVAASIDSLIHPTQQNFV